MDAAKIISESSHQNPPSNNKVAKIFIDRFKLPLRVDKRQGLF